MASSDWIVRTDSGSDSILKLSGDWTNRNAGRIDRATSQFLPLSRDITAIDIGQIGRMDTAGAWLVEKLRRQLEQGGSPASLQNARQDHTLLLDRLRETGQDAAPEPERHSALWLIADRTGRATFDVLSEAVDLLNFLGLSTVAAVRTLTRPRRLRVTALVHHIEQVGLNALPIVGLLAFLIGVVLAYQGADQLRRFGAEIFTVNLLGISILREMGILLTAIIVAGRSGSAFTAQIGTMQVN